MSGIVASINALIRELIKLCTEARFNRARQEDLLRVLDELETQIDNMVQALVPEKITDERFRLVEKGLRELMDKLREVREFIVFGRLVRAKKKLLEVQELARHVYRLMLIIRAGAPTPMIFQFTPFRTVELPAVEPLLFSNPMAAQIYNVLQRRGEMSLEDLAREMHITDANRDEFNRAISLLISMGYVTPYLTHDNRLILRARR